MQIFPPVDPEKALHDARICLRFQVEDPTTSGGRHYLTLLDSGYYIFVVAYQRAVEGMVNENKQWLGGTLLELPIESLSPMLSAMEYHYHNASHLSLRSQAVFKYAKTFAEEAMSLSRDYVLPGYTLKNCSRKVHLPWAGDGWAQELRLADSVLFEGGYCSALKQLSSVYT